MGGGLVAARKVRRLLNAGAQVTVVSIDTCDAINKLGSANSLRIHRRPYQSTDLDAVKFVVAATDDAEVNQQIAKEAEILNIWCNTAENIQANSVIFPSLVQRDRLSIAVSSDGASPVLARVVSDQIDAFIPAYIGKLTSLAADFRQQVKNRFDTIEDRRRFWHHVITGKVSRLLESGNDKAAKDELNLLLKNQHGADHPMGEVYLVGAGPGDPELLTLRALRLMQKAEVVLHDRLVSEPILSMCPSSAEFVYVGKERSSHAMRQQNINQSLVDYARQGKRVLRLKGGDPFIFGRGGEEIETLAQNGVDFQVVPGITAASGCASYAGIPLTHRDHAQSCVFVTGQLKNGTIDLPWESLALPNQTIVCYMGLVGLPHMCAALIKANLSSSTPAALIEQGTRSHQRVITGTLESLPSQVAEQEVKAPTLIIIGQVVQLQERLAWFHRV